MEAGIICYLLFLYIKRKEGFKIKKKKNVTIG